MADPDTFLTLANQGETLLSSGDSKAAISRLKQALELNSEHYPAWILLGRAYYSAGEFPAAVEAVKNAEKCDPHVHDFAKIQHAMRSQNFAQAREIANQALQETPGYPRAVFTLAHLFQMQGSHESRVNTLEEGLTISPANIALRQMLVGAYEDCGAYSEAIKTAEQLVQIEPIFVNLFGLMQIYMRYGFNENVLTIAGKAWLSCQADKNKQSEVSLLKGHALRTLGRSDEAISAYQICLEKNATNMAAMWALANMKTYVFSADEKHKLENILSKETLAPAQMTNALFALARAEEQQQDLSKAIQLYEKANASHQDRSFSADNYAKAVDHLVKSFTPNVTKARANIYASNPTPIFIVGLPRSGSTLIEQILASHSQIEGTMELPTLPGTKRKLHFAGTHKFSGNYTEILGQLSSEELTDFGENYLKDSAIFRKEKRPYFIDKLPHNFEHIGLIHKILPHAVIIDARRHPLDCGLSLFKQHFARGSNFSYNLHNIGAYYNGYLKIMDHWNALLPQTVLHIQYEELVKNTETEIRRILNHIGLGFEHACLTFYNNPRTVRTASSEQVRQPVFTSSIGLWKSVEQSLEPLKESLGPETIERFANL